MECNLVQKHTHVFKPKLHPFLNHNSLLPNYIISTSTCFDSILRHFFLGKSCKIYHTVDLVFYFLWTPLPLRVSCILFLLTLSSLNYTFRIGEKRKWLLIQEAPNFETIHPWEHLRKCLEKSMETMHTDVKLQKVTLTSNFQ